MGRRHLPLRARTVSVVALVAAVGLLCTACSWAEGLREEAVHDAEDGVAIGLEYSLPRASELVRTKVSVEELTTAELEDAFGAVIVDPPKSTPLPVSNSYLYGLESEGASVTFSVLLRSGESRSGGGVTYNVTRFGCAELSGVFGEPAISVSDVPCPEDYADWGDDAEEVSVTAVAERFGVPLEHGSGER